jgi:hypothetical protein
MQVGVVVDIGHNGSHVFRVLNVNSYDIDEFHCMHDWRKEHKRIVTWIIVSVVELIVWKGKGVCPVEYH